MPDEIPVDGTATLAWLKQISEAARDAARAGDVIPANRIGSNTALSHYFNNVMTGAISPESWVINYPYHLKEADRIRRSQEQANAQEERISNMEKQIAEILGLLKGQSTNGDHSDDKPAAKGKRKTAD